MKKNFKKKLICFDLDNTLCNTKGNKYKNSTPIKKKINFVNKLYDEGHYIIIFTARFMGKFAGNHLKVKKYGYNFTKKQLIKWDLNHHELIMCKPTFDYMIDDKSIGFKKNWIESLKKKLK
jgi:hypothetical protein